MDVHTGRMLDVAAALQQIDIGNRADVFYACRALLVHRREELALFARAFDAFWTDLRGAAPAPPTDTRAGAPPGSTPHTGNAGPPGGADDSMLPGREAVVPVPVDVPEHGAVEDRGPWSSAARLAARDFAEFTSDEILLARSALDRLTWNPGERRTRRWTAGRGPRVDLRHAFADSLRTGGDIATLPRRRRKTRQRPLVVICDVSGSMERHSRMLLHFAHAMGRRRRVEAFLFATSLTRVTPELRTRDLDEAVTAVSKSVRDWSGGTRTGDALRELNQRWSRRVLHGGPVVLLISDGWDRGDPGVLRGEIARLQRSCHRLIWLNPLIGTPGYAPLTRGLQAALPFVDDFLPARTLTNLTDLAVHLNALGTARSGRGSPAKARRHVPGSGYSRSG